MTDDERRAVFLEGVSWYREHLRQQMTTALDDATKIVDRVVCPREVTVCDGMRVRLVNGRQWQQYATAIQRWADTHLAVIIQFCPPQDVPRDLRILADLVERPYE